MDQLIKQVKQLGESLSGHVNRGEFDLRLVFFQLSAAAGAKKGPLLDVDEDGYVVINSAHPMAQKLADGQPGRARVLVSAIISLVNRAEKDLTDEHQRALHKKIMDDMVN